VDTVPHEGLVSDIARQALMATPTIIWGPAQLASGCWVLNGEATTPYWVGLSAALVMSLTVTLAPTALERFRFFYFRIRDPAAGWLKTALLAVQVRGWQHPTRCRRTRHTPFPPFALS